MKFEVSVIIPVYNAEKYLANAVESALYHDCVKEVILIEDASPDNALQVCKKLESKYDRVKLYQHTNGENRGAGASRNLGIEKATAPYIAFLDADDWYTEIRFDAEKEIFKDASIEGVYGCGGYYFEDKKIKSQDKFTTFTSKVTSDNLFYEIVRPNGGRFDTNSITIKKSLLKKTGLFDTSLRLHQDSYLWLKLAYHGKLVGGEINTPISYRRVHDENRITKANRKSAFKYHKKVYNYFKHKKNISFKIMRILFKNLIINQTESNNNIVRGTIALKEIIKYPKIIFSLIQ